MQALLLLGCAEATQRRQTLIQRVSSSSSPRSRALLSEASLGRAWATRTNAGARAPPSTGSRRPCDRAAATSSGAAIVGTTAARCADKTNDSWIRLEAAEPRPPLRPLPLPLARGGAFAGTSNGTPESAPGAGGGPWFSPSLRCSFPRRPWWRIWRRDTQKRSATGSLTHQDIVD